MSALDVAAALLLGLGVIVFVLAAVATFSRDPEFDDQDRERLGYRTSEGRKLIPPRPKGGKRGW